MTEFMPPEPLKTAVLLLVFNRPELTARVFDAIRQARPPRLYIAADGPRAGREGERELSERVRRIATAVDWDCDVITLFREENLGCRRAVSGGIDWFFDHEKEGIILEDDCLPCPSFFWFCEAMLERYRHDARIAQVSGFNSITDAYTPFASTYLYSSYGSIWGWATWSDRWSDFEVDLKPRDEDGLVDYVLEALPIDEYPDRRRIQLDRVISNKQQTWDYQWMFARLAASRLSIVPRTNLVTNIGFGEDSTHMSTQPKFTIPEPQDVLPPFVSPPMIVRDRKRDIALLDTNYARIGRSPRAVLGRWIKPFLRKLDGRKNE